MALVIFTFLILSGAAINNVNAVNPVTDLDGLKSAVVEAVHDAQPVYIFNEG